MDVRHAPAVSDPDTDVGVQLAADPPFPSASAGGRVVPLEETWSRLRAVLPLIGVTRLGDITGLDRLGIPVWQAIAPRSDDLVSVYSGKGATPTAAKVSAAMEAFERYCASVVPPIAVEAAYADLRTAGVRALDPSSLAAATDPSWHPGTVIPWTWGHDLVSGQPTLVATSQAVHRMRRVGPPVNRLSTTSGLAGGNTLSEAVLHGLLEVVERDAWTLADLLGHRLPRLLLERGVSIANPAVRPLSTDDLDADGAGMLAAFTAADLDVSLYSMTADTRVPVVTALVQDPYGSHGLSSAHQGFGCDPDPQLAVRRALGEVAQSRAGDISGTCEDYSAAGDDVPPWMRHAQRRGDETPAPLLGLGEPVEIGRLDGWTGTSPYRLLTETLDRVRGAGLEQVVVVDLSVPGADLHVARTLVPGAESWSTDHSRLGPRATTAWNATLRRLADEGAG